MSQIPSPPPPGYPPSAPGGYGSFQPPIQRSNGVAIASLVLGLLMCIPFITGIAAIILGALGIRKARDPQVGGKGMAIAGLILGLVGLFAWCGCLGLGGYAYVASRPARNVASQFLSDVNHGNTPAALNESIGMTTADIEKETERMVPWGTFQSATFWSAAASSNYSAANGASTSSERMHLTGTATFANSPHICTFDLVKQGGTYKVESYTIQ